MAQVFIGMGSNLGDRRAHIEAALDRMRRLPRTRVVKVSPLIETEPVGVTDQPKFLNGAAELETALAPRGLLRALQEIEKDLGRVRTHKWGPRTIDLDILLYDNRVMDTPELQVPHPRMAERKFVLAPLARIAPDAVHPVSGKTVCELLAGVKAEEGKGRSQGTGKSKRRAGGLEGIHFIAVEGPIGVGKTTLAGALAQRLDARLVLERAEDNPFLEKFYADMVTYALPTQLAFLISRYRQQAELLQGDLFASKVVSDYVLAKDRIFAALTLKEDELNLYNQLHDALAVRAARPDVVVLLQADADTLLGRIRRRGIPYEAGVDREYLERLAAAYHDYFRAYSGGALLVVDTAEIDYEKGEVVDLDALIWRIGQTAAPGR